MGCQGKNIVLLDIPFQYRTLGAANEGVRFPVIPLGKEKQALSLALVRALQGMEYSIVAPTVLIGEPLPEMQLLQTDAVPLSMASIKGHNSSSAIASIPTNALYRLSYELKYSVKPQTTLAEKHFSLMVWSKLERRGAGGQWHDYPRPYSGKYFAEQLRERIESELERVGPIL